MTFGTPCTISAPCPTGTYQVAHSDGCQSCPAGSVSKEGSSSCKECENGEAPNGQRSACGNATFQFCQNDKYGIEKRDGTMA